MTTFAVSDSRLYGGALGLAAAALFGASTPLVKLLIPGAHPLVLVGLLYLGAGLGVTAYRRGLLGERREQEARLRRADVLPLICVVLLGGVAAPTLMLIGLRRVPGVVGSLLLNLEAVFTMLLAIIAFGEHLGRRESAAAVIIVGGAALLGYRPGELHVDSWGIAALAGACIAWAIDNNVSQRLSLRDPLVIVEIKGFAAGTGALAVGLVAGQGLPGITQVLAALAVGSLSYGASLVFDMQALRALGAAREAAFFATAPFIGAVLSVPVLGERTTPVDWVSGGLMACGVALLLRAHHQHAHTHNELDHDHLHVHDEHHQHIHPVPVAEPHAHWHRHDRLTHDHAHVSDLHHRHSC